MPSSLRSASVRRVGLAALTATVGLAGVLAMHHSMILSGFRRLQTDMGDTRLLNYFMEHGWLWVSGAPLHESFWNAPFFYPVPNVMAFSDCLLSYGPFYWLFRGIGLAPDTAFGVWIVTMTVLNYMVGVLLFRRGLGFGAASSAAAAGLIAFGSPRLNQIHHLQLLPCFYLLLALFALCRIVRDQDAGAGRRAGSWTAFSLAVAAQFYGAYYPGWFFVIGLGIAVVSAFALRSTRRQAVDLAKRDWWAVALGGAIGGVVMLPFLAHYLPAARELGAGFSDMQIHAQPVAWSWWNVGGVNWIWGWVERRWPLGSMFPDELRLGIGFVTTTACALGFYLRRRDPLARAVFTAMFFGVSALTFPMNHLGAVTACLALARLLREPDWNGINTATFALTTVGLLAAHPRNTVALGLSLVMAAFCVLRIGIVKERRNAWAAPAAALAALSFHLLSMDMALLMAAFFAPVGAAVGYLAPSRRFESAMGALGLWLGATAWLTVEDSSGIFQVAALGTILGWLFSAAPQSRPGSLALAATLAIATPAVLMPWGDASLWLAVCSYIPGSGAIRMPARAVLAFLVPAALGLAFLIDRLDRGRWSVAAWCLVLICLAEQMGATESFDRDANRRRIAALVQKVDRHAKSFFYRPDYNGDYYINLDAMWASAATGVPTVNGYSGCFPIGWLNLGGDDAPIKGTTEEALQDWCDRYNLPRSDVQRIIRPADETAANPAVDLAPLFSACHPPAQPPSGR